MDHEFKGKRKEQYNYIASNYDFRFNVVTGLIEYKLKKTGFQWIEYDDRAKSDLLLELSEEVSELPENRLNMFVESKTVSPDFDPFENYFENLKEWDGKTDYIGQLAATVTTDNENFGEIFKRYLVGSLDCLLNKNATNDVCLILQSKQGLGKTRWMRKLMPNVFINKYYYEGEINTKHNDHVQYLSQFWFIHLDELESLRSNQIGSIKAFITKNKISLRKAYGRYKRTYVRRASFLGSVNDDKFLNDITGNRRWLVFSVFNIDYQHQLDINKVWAQAYHLYSQDYKYWFDADEIKGINAQNEKFRSVTLEEEVILKGFDFNVIDSYLSASEVMEIIAEKKPRLASQISVFRIGKVLSRYGKSQKRIQGVNKYQCAFAGDENINDDELPF